MSDNAIRRKCGNDCDTGIEPAIGYELCPKCTATGLALLIDITRAARKTACWNTMRQTILTNVFTEE